MNKAFKICVITTTRAEYGILKPLILALQKNTCFDVRLVVTGTHLVDNYGKTITEIKNDKVEVSKEISIINILGDSVTSITKTMCTAMESFTEYFISEIPDLIIVLGDRYELFSICVAAYNCHIPICHLHGGETTEGLLDEFYRHAITKMSYLHFTSCAEYRKRVIQLGESPDRVFDVGALGVENVLHQKLLSVQEVSELIDFNLVGKKYVVVTFHPVTMEKSTMNEQMTELIAAMDAFSELCFVITKSNADAGGRKINEIWDNEGRKYSNWLVVDSLGMQRYLSVLKGAEMMLGNSSSGILEAPAMHIPTVNIGDRQRGRLQAESIINCEPQKNAIVASIRKAMTPEFKKITQNVYNPFGDGHTSEKIVAVIKDFLVNKKINLKKKFYDVDFEIE